ncbi:MAG: (E)-4-hydroxy-3-methylbut-2-enyl-diphosphate synthase [Rikenellaceae bacterium]|nr:(E)-4-hydroxy-3-methylbut-2-enyl-diphosphate synthase [Rikenellaceae bacterium]
MKKYCNSLGRYARRVSNRVRIGNVEIGDGAPIAVQSMTNTDTNDTAASVAQIERIDRAGGPIVRLTAQGPREGENLRNIVAQLRSEGFSTAIVADIHFVPEVAEIAAESVDKVRINPGNYRTSDRRLERLIEKCRTRGVALRIGVNHGSLAKRVFDEWGDTPEGMVVSAMEFLRVCRAEGFDQVVVSMKSSNTRVMVYAYRLLVAAMREEAMTYPIHLGVTEAGDGIEGRVKSAVGIGALLADGVGDTIRVSLTEDPENEIPVAQMLADYFTDREGEFEVAEERFSPYEYRRRATRRVGCIGGDQVPVTHSELSDNELDIFVAEAVSKNPVAEWRSAILDIEDDTPVVIARTYDDEDFETLAVKAAADMGVMLLDGLADGIWINAPQFPAEKIKELELMIMQAARVRFSRTEYIACPSCGRTLYDLQTTLAKIKAATSHLKDLKIGVMGCIVNGPGEMADADYGYVGAAPERITLYRGREIVERNIPQAEALDRLVALIKADGRWTEPTTEPAQNEQRDE